MVACKAAMLLCEAMISVVDEGSTAEVESLIALIQKMGHSGFDIEDHLAEHTISPAKPATVVNLRELPIEKGRNRAHHDRV